MSEVLKRIQESKLTKVAVGTVLDGLMLVGCGESSSKDSSWQIGVKCPEAESKVDVKSVTNNNRNHSRSTIDIDCGKNEPTAIELLKTDEDTDEAIVNDGTDFTAVLNITTVHEQGGYYDQDPSVEFDAEDKTDSITFTDVERVSSVNVGAPNQG